MSYIYQYKLYVIDVISIYPLAQRRSLLSAGRLATTVAALSSAVVRRSGRHSVVAQFRLQFVCQQHFWLDIFARTIYIYRTNATSKLYIQYCYTSDVYVNDLIFVYVLLWKNRCIRHIYMFQLEFEIY